MKRATARVWVTRDEPPEDELSTALRNAGLEPVLEPVVRRARLADAMAELAQLRRDDWLLLTSAFALECLAIDSIPGGDEAPSVAVVGRATEAVALARGLRVELVGEGPGASALVA